MTCGNGKYSQPKKQLYINHRHQGLCILLPLLCGLFAVVAQAKEAVIVAEKPTYCLQISRFYTQETLGWWALGDSPVFALSFIHSVSETPVVDFYRLEGHQIIQTAERFEHHGAGLPSHISEGNEWQHRDGYFWLSMQRPIAQLVVRTDSSYRNRLHLGEAIAPHDEQLSLTVNLNQWPDTALWIQPAVCPKVPLPMPSSK